MSTCFCLGLFSLEVIFLLFGLLTITSPLIFFPFPLVSFCKTFAPGSRVMLDLPIMILCSVIACWVASPLSGFSSLTSLLSLHLLLDVLLRLDTIQCEHWLVTACDPLQILSSNPAYLQTCHQRYTPIYLTTIFF